MQFKDSIVTEVRDIDIKELWPKLLFDYLQTKIKWISFDLQNQITLNNGPNETKNPTGEPKVVLCKYPIQF